MYFKLAEGEVFSCSSIVNHPLGEEDVVIFLFMLYLSKRWQIFKLVSWYVWMYVSVIQDKNILILSCIWSNYSDLTRPISPKGSVLEGKSPYFTPFGQIIAVNKPTNLHSNGFSDVREVRSTSQGVHRRKMTAILSFIIQLYNHQYNSSSPKES